MRKGISSIAVLRNVGLINFITYYPHIHKV
jgi:hypothetical protein